MCIRYRCKVCIRGWQSLRKEFLSTRQLSEWVLQKSFVALIGKWSDGARESDNLYLYTGYRRTV